MPLISLNRKDKSVYDRLRMGRAVLSTEIRKVGDDNEIHLSYNLVIKLIGLSVFIFLFGMVFYIQFILDPAAFTKPIFYVPIFFLGFVLYLLIEFFTTGYSVDSIGIHKHSFFTRRNEIKWEDITWIYPDDFDSITVMTDTTKFRFSPRFDSGLPHLAAFLKEKVPEENMSEVIGKVDALYQDKLKMESGGSKFWIGYKHYSPLVSSLFFLMGFLIVNDYFSMDEPRNSLKLGLGGLLFLIGAILLAIRKKRT